jgi:hypothetical protein
MRAIPCRAILMSAMLASLTRPAPAQRCVRPDTTGEWFQRQRAWLSDARHDWSDDAFRAVLLSAAGLDASRPVPAQIGAQTVREQVPSSGADSMTLSRLATLARTRGSTWPTRSVVGAAGVRAVWLLAQRDTALQRVVLHRMMESGPDEALPADVAVLEDRVRVQSGRKQLYGTQLQALGGRPGALPTEDSAHVDLRRDAAGLPPLAAAICAVVP